MIFHQPYFATRSLDFSHTEREGLTAGEVWRVVGVGQEQVVGLGHPEVHHLGCVLQSPHRILMHHILKTHVVHLSVRDKQGNTIGITNCKTTRLRETPRSPIPF